MELHSDVTELHAENQRLKAESTEHQARFARCCGELGAEMGRRERAEREVQRLRTLAERAEAARARLIGLHVRESSQGWDLLVSDCSTRLGFTWLRGFESRELAVGYLLHDLGLDVTPADPPTEEQP